MADSDAVLAIIREHRGLAAHWRSAHYASSRWYQFLDYSLGIPSTVLATSILGFAFYAVDRPNTPLWTQYLLAALTVLQGILSAVQMYVRPGPLAESYKNSATNFGSTQRMWLALEEKCLLGKIPTLDELDGVLVASNQATREARPVPTRILKKFGLRPTAEPSAKSNQEKA